METPTINRKKGKTKSVGVQPSQGGCRKGGKTWFQVPGVFTKIIRAIVIPRKASKAVNRFVIFCGFRL